MKEKIESLLNISKSLDLIDIVTEVEFIRERLGQENTELIIPIVGEFSSGKTTLINSLTNSKKLETASKPTTSSIYEIYFESETEFAELIYSDGKIDVVDDISSLKNDQA